MTEPVDVALPTGVGRAPHVVWHLGAVLLTDETVALTRDLTASRDHLDVHEAALLEDDSTAELARLRTRRFVDGAVRVWSEREEVVELTVLRFATADDARLAARETIDALVAATAVLRIDDRDAPPVAALRFVDDGSGFVGDVAIGSCGTCAVSIVVGCLGDPAPGLATRLLRAQMKCIPTGE